ncbi:MAG: alcohol dehydrogenase catalytic domain-containing protein [Aeromicrobium sp.]
MKAFRLYASNDVRMVDVEVPTPGPGEALIRVAASGVCGSDVHGVAEADRYGYPLPYTLGHETTGYVASFGEPSSPDETGAEPEIGVGDAVALYPLIFCGRCPSCAAGQGNQCRSRFPISLGAGRDGGMAEYVVAPTSNLVRLGDLDPVIAAPLTDAGMTSHNAVSIVKDRLGPGSTCVVIGVGGLGHLALQLLQALTPARVIAVDSDPVRLEHSREFGAHEIVAAGEGAEERIGELCGGLGAEVVLDFVGSPETVELDCRVVASGGKLVVVGLSGGVVPVSLGGALPPQTDVVVPLAGGLADLRAVVELARDGRLRPVVTSYPLAEAQDVLDRLHRGVVEGRAVLIP